MDHAADHGLGGTVLVKYPHVAELAVDSVRHIGSELLAADDQVANSRSVSTTSSSTARNSESSNESVVGV